MENASALEVSVYNKSLESRERFASHVENMVRGELINNGFKNMNLSTEYSSRKAIFTSGTIFKVTYEITTYKLLENNPYNAAGYFNKSYNLPIIKK